MNEQTDAATVSFQPNRSGLFWIFFRNVKIDWAMIKSVAEVKSAILVNLNPLGMQIIPKKHVATAELAAFRAFLRAHAPGGAKLPKD